MRAYLGVRSGSGRVLDLACLAGPALLRGGGGGRDPPGARAQGARAPHSTGRGRGRGAGESGAHSRRPAGVSGLSGVSCGSVGSAGAMRAAGAARRGGTWWATQSGAGSGARTGRAMRGRIDAEGGAVSPPASARTAENLGRACASVQSP